MLRKSWAIGGVVLKEMTRRKDFYVLFILTAVLTVAMGSVNVFDDTRMVRYLKELCLTLVWLAVLVIAVTSAARQIPAEREHRTIFPLLAKPVSRWELVFGKFIGCFLACGIALFVFYLFFAIISFSRERELFLANCVFAFLLHWIFCAVVVAMTLLGSVVLSTPSANATLCFLAASSILFLGRHLKQIALSMQEPLRSVLQVGYFAMPHLEFFDIRDLVVHNHPAPFSAGDLALVTGYGALYTTFFLVAAWAVFRRRPLSV